MNFIYSNKSTCTHTHPPLHICLKYTVARGCLKDICMCVRERERETERGYERVKQGNAGAREIDPDMTCL